MLQSFEFILIKSSCKLFRGNHSSYILDAMPLTTDKGDGDDDYGDD